VTPIETSKSNNNNNNNSGNPSVFKFRRDKIRQTYGVFFLPKKYILFARLKTILIVNMTRRKKF